LALDLDLLLFLDGVLTLLPRDLLLTLEPPLKSSSSSAEEVFLTLERFLSLVRDQLLSEALLFFPLDQLRSSCLDQLRSFLANERLCLERLRFVERLLFFE